MTLGPSLLILYEGEEVYKKLRDAKGMFRLKDGRIQKSGLRLKYQGLSKEELTKLGYRGKQLFYRSFEYRIHTSDSLSDTIFLCKLLLSSEDYALLEQTGKLVQI